MFKNLRPPRCEWVCPVETMEEDERKKIVGIVGLAPSVQNQIFSLTSLGWLWVLGGDDRSRCQDSWTGSYQHCVDSPNLHLPPLFASIWTAEQTINRTQDPVFDALKRKWIILTSMIWVHQLQQPLMHTDAADHPVINMHTHMWSQVLSVVTSLPLFARYSSKTAVPPACAKSATSRLSVHKSGYETQVKDGARCGSGVVVTGTQGWWKITDLAPERQPKQQLTGLMKHTIKVQADSEDVVGWELEAIVGEEKLNVIEHNLEVVVESRDPSTL
ncbi:hypothetical protein DFP72DRAFT_843283 [Ephemerocybe angulata]|uniref:Uncharacterized protein n=1 Tax=Ephemerocybe angulata TaxID=980116 RepID=A0A8H6MDT9_9AGAR|nr:hypothetical protein DFP72DRAFT_843283 [Tulosesus angulatus]